MNYIVTTCGKTESWHKTQAEAVEHCRHQIQLWIESGATPPAYAVWYNPSREKVWES